MSVDNAIEDRREIDSQAAMDILVDKYENQLLSDDEFVVKEWKRNFDCESLLKHIEFNKENDSIQFTVGNIKKCETIIPMVLKHSKPI